MLVVPLLLETWRSCRQTVFLQNLYRYCPTAKAFDKLNLLQHLKPEEEQVKGQPRTPSPPMAGLPVPSFVDAKADDMSGTIPWQSDVLSRDNDGAKQATASNQDNGNAGNSRTVVEIAHHHHLHL